MHTRNFLTGKERVPHGSLPTSRYTQSYMDQSNKANLTYKYLQEFDHSCSWKVMDVFSTYLGMKTSWKKLMYSMVTQTFSQQS